MNTVLITGASGGIGEAIARKIAAGNENLMLVARNEGKLKHISTEISEKFNVNIDYITADLSKPDAAAYVYQECKTRKLEVNCLINNAGIGSGGEFSKADLKDLISMMQLNNNAMVSLTHFFLQDMLRRKKGTIVNIGSLISFVPVPYMALYGATKSFVRSFSQALHEECKPQGINVLFFAPGLTTTNFMEAADLKNDTGNALIAGAPVQSAEQVADEFMIAYMRRSRARVSGRINRFAVKLLALIPGWFVAAQSAKTFRKRIAKKM